jgi:hypothetical protein
MAKSYAARYGRETQKTGKTTQYRNQGYSYGDIYTGKQREDSYDKWKINPTPYKEPGEPRTQHGTVDSSWLTELGYNAHTGEAEAKFKDTNAMFYYKMPYEVFLEWLNSPSKGRWLHNSGYLKDYRQQGGVPAKNGNGRVDARTLARGNGQVRKRALAKMEKYR